MKRTITYEDKLYQYRQIACFLPRPACSYRLYSVLPFRQARGVFHVCAPRAHKMIFKGNSTKRQLVRYIKMSYYFMF